jgi:LacI family transcriptional regulator
MKQVKRITRKDVAREAQVSLAVVTWVMNGTASEHRISNDTITKVQQVIDKLGYSPSIWGKLIHSQRSNVIALISPDLTDANTSEIIKSLNKHATAQGYTIMLFEFSSANIKKTLFADPDNSLADAFLLHMPNDEIIEHFNSTNKPVCVISRHMANTPFDLPSVEVDNTCGAKLAMEYLLSTTPSSLGIIVDSAERSYTNERLAGCHEIIENYPDLQVFYYHRQHNENQFQTGAAAIDTWFKSGTMPQALFAMGDVIALGALSALNQHNINCPGQIRLAGFDGTILSEYASPPLTTITQPFDEMSKNAISICRTLLAGKKVTAPNISLKPKLTRRIT